MAKFEAGVAAVDISPGEDWFRTLVTRQEDKVMVLVTADLLEIRDCLRTRTCEEIRHIPGLEDAAVAVTASHTHSGPPYGEGDPYGEWLAQQITASAQAAVADLAPARIGATHGFRNDLSYYERIAITRDNARSLGADPKHVGGVKHSRDYFEARAAAGPVDPQVGVVRIDRADGTPRAVLVHFTAHPAIEIEPPHVSPDYVGFAMKKIQREVPGVVALFCQGAAGAVNINNIFGTLVDARRHGETLAGEVLRVLDTMETTRDVEAAHVAGSSFLEYSPIPPQDEIDRELAIYRAYLERRERNPDEVWLGYGRYTRNLPPHFPPEARRRAVEFRMRLLDGVRSKPGHVFPPAPLELQVFRWNDIVLVFNSFELFVQPGLEVKRRSPYRYTLPVCYSGGGPAGYLGPPDEIARGGYHFVFFNPARSAPGNAERLVEEMVKLVTRG